MNASEDAQLQEALRKSVEEAKATAQARTTQPALPEISDDDWLNEDDDLETFSDSDTEDKPMPNTPVKKPATATATASSAAVRESAAPTELSEEFLNNQASVACGDSSKNGESELKPKNGTIPAADTQESCSAVNKTEPGVLTATESTWRTHVGCSQGAFFARPPQGQDTCLITVRRRDAEQRAATVRLPPTSTRPADDPRDSTPSVVSDKGHACEAWAMRCAANRKGCVWRSRLGHDVLCHKLRRGLFGKMLTCGGS